MDKSGPRYPALKYPIIERPDLQSLQQQTIYGALTIVFWALWFYLWLPVLAFFAWLLGVQQAYKYMIVLEGYHDVIRLLGVYSLVIVLLGGSLVLWALYNIIRFRGIENRTATSAITPAEIGRDLGMDPVALERWQKAQRLYVTHDQAGRVARVDILVAGAPLPD
jgi:biofilm PGA synthesis protein PgaD